MNICVYTTSYSGINCNQHHFQVRSVYSVCWSHRVHSYTNPHNIRFLQITKRRWTTWVKKCHFSSASSSFPKMYASHHLWIQETNFASWKLVNQDQTAEGIQRKDCRQWIDVNYKHYKNEQQSSYIYFAISCQCWSPIILLQNSVGGRVKRLEAQIVSPWPFFNWPVENMCWAFNFGWLLRNSPFLNSQLNKALTIPEPHTTVTATTKIFVKIFWKDKPDVMWICVVDLLCKVNPVTLTGQIYTSPENEDYSSFHYKVS